MKKVLLLFCLGVFMVGSGFSTISETAVITAKQQAIASELSSMTADELLNMTPAKYKQITGKKLGLKNTLALKAAQKSAKKQMMKAGAPAIDKTVYIILAIFISFVAVGLATNWDGKDWVICLLLSFLCGIPGIIYALVKMKDYY